jgi:hypothetical protein
LRSPKRGKLICWGGGATQNSLRDTDDAPAKPVGGVCARYGAVGLRRQGPDFAIVERGHREPPQWFASDKCRSGIRATRPVRSLYQGLHGAVPELSPFALTHPCEASLTECHQQAEARLAKRTNQSGNGTKRTCRRACARSALDPKRTLRAGGEKALKRRHDRRWLHSIHRRRCRVTGIGLAGSKVIWGLMPITASGSRVNRYRCPTAARIIAASIKAKLFPTHIRCPPQNG